MDLGKKFRQIREEKQLTKYKLTQITGISGHHIKGIEEGTRQPTIDTLQRLLEAMGCTMADFFSENAQAVTLSEEERELIEKLRTMDKKDAEAIMTICHRLK